MHTSAQGSSQDEEQRALLSCVNSAMIQRAPYCLNHEPLTLFWRHERQADTFRNTIYLCIEMNNQVLIQLILSY